VDKDIIIADTINPVILTARLENYTNIVINNKAISTMAGSFDDPVRLIPRYASTINTNDQNNAFSYRGLPAHYTVWTLNGAEITNPNHLMGAGTGSDKFNFGGGVNMISGNVIESLNIIPYPNLKGLNSQAITADFNTKEYSPTYFNLSLIGLEAGISKKVNKSQFFANYRYSFTGLLGEAGVDFGDEAITYQDLYIGHKTVFKNAVLNTNIIIGSSANDHESIYTLPGEFNLKDIQDIYYDNQTFISSINYSNSIFKDWKWKNTLNYSHRSDHRTSSFDDDYQGFNLNKEENIFDLEEKKLSFNSIISNANINLGIKYLNHKTSLYDVNNFIHQDSSINQQVYSTFANYTLPLSIVQMTLGAGYEYHKNIDQGFISPLLQIEKKINAVVINYGLSNNPRFPLYELLSFKIENPELSSSINHDFSVSISKSFYSKIGVYYQTFEKLPALSQYSSFNGIPYHFIDFTGNQNGKAKSYGAYAIFEYGKANNYWFQSNISLIKSKFKNDKNENYNSSPNEYGLSINANISKTLIYQPKKAKELSISMAFIYHQGGFQYQIFKSIEPLQNFGANPYKRNEYFRPDLRVVFKNRKSTLSLDIQNIISRQNEGYYLFNFIKNQIEHYPQLGLIPVLSWKYNI
jgi:hypothetical protein